MAIFDNKYRKELNQTQKAVIKKFNRGGPSEWRNRDFEDLSFEIKKSTRILISAATLKRIFGKNKTSDSYFPQQTTIDALKNYSGYEEKRTAPIKWWWLLFLLPVVIIFLFRNKTKNNDTPVSGTIELFKIEGSNPATAFFNLSFPESNDSVFIRFGDDYPPQYLLPNQKSITHFYGRPGLFHAFLQTRQQIISDTVNVLIETNDWQALAAYYHQEFNDRYYPIPLIMASGPHGFHPTKKTLFSVGMDTTRIVVLHLENFRRTGANADSFALKTRLKNVSFWPAIRCYSVYVDVLGSKNKIRFKLTNEGCSSFGEFVLSEKKGTGRTGDLSEFTIDIKKWTDVEIKNENRNVKVKINSNEVFDETYTQPLGEIVGVSLQFHGSGYVDYFELFDKNNQPVFEKHF